MAIKLVREFQQKQQIAITPQLKKSIDLLQLSRVEIINKINEEAEDNPFLIKEYELIFKDKTIDSTTVEKFDLKLVCQQFLNNYRN